MKRSQLWSASVTLMIIIAMIGAYSIIGPVFGQESGSSEGGGEHRATSSEGVGEHGGSGSEGLEGSGSASAHTLQIL